jgi:hypothetical protein
VIGHDSRLLLGDVPALLDDQGRDSPILKHYPQIKNPCFVTCVNSVLCS